MEGVWHTGDSQGRRGTPLNDLFLGSQVCYMPDMAEKGKALKLEKYKKLCACVLDSQ